MDLFDELMAVLEALDASGASYAVCGACAVNVHGHARATTDIDLLVPEDQVDPVRAAVRPLGFTFAALPMTFDVGTPRERRVHRVSKIAGEETLTLDLLVVGPAFRVAWETREVFALRDRKMWCVSLEGLATMKKLAGRHQDLADLEALGIDSP